MLSAQTKVGLLIIASVIVAMGVIINLSEIHLSKGYEFYVMFDDIADLPARPIVKISGVEVGKVNKIELYKGKARIKVWLREDIEVHSDARVKILKMGMIGNTFVSMTRGSSGSPVVQAGETLEGINPISYEEVIDSFVSGLDKVVAVFQKIGENETLGRDIGQTFTNLRDLSAGLNSAIGEDGRKLSKAVNNISGVTSEIREIFSNIDLTFSREASEISSSIRKLGSAADDLGKILVNINEGKGTAGKLLTSDEYGEKVGKAIDSIYEASVDLKQAVNRFKGFDTVWDAGVYYEADSELFRTYSSLTFMTSSERFLNVGVENIMPEDDIPGPRDESGDRFNALTLKAGKNFGPFFVFGGAIRASGGIGAGWEYASRLKVDTQVFEFGRDNPWWTLSSRLRLMPFLILGVAYEDILDEGKLRTGVEIELE